jgi:hypothetical protein
MPRFKLVTALPPEQCLSRMSAAGDIAPSLIRAPSSVFGSKPVTGRATLTSLHLRKRIGYGNSFQTHLAASMSREEGGTVISGTLGMHPVTEAFMVIWFGFTVLIGGSLFVVSLRALLAGDSASTQESWIGVLAFPAMLAFGYGLVRFGRHLARDEARFLKEFLIRTLDAREVDALNSESNGLRRARGGWGAA